MAVLWVGGTSALAGTYFDEVHPSKAAPFIIVAAPTPPAWALPADTAAFVPLDLFSEESVSTLWRRLPRPCQALIFGVRLSLVWESARQLHLASNLRLLLRGARAAGCRAVLHVSSVAVMNHVTAQSDVSEEEPLPPMDAYESDYDRFKRISEDTIDECCTAWREGGQELVAWTHLRISGIFSNDPACIQCLAVGRWQALAAFYQPGCIDFNSAANTAHAIALLLERLLASTAPAASGSPPPPPRQVYFYTRATESPVPYGSLIADYRAANNIWYGMWLPGWVFYPALGAIRSLLAMLHFLPLLKNLGYLLTVSAMNHTFDNSRFRHDFPAICEVEEG